ncbi:2-oxoacid ferredoxin oxidoreductase, gamma subunit [Desulfatibacillum aliphaticivorans]|uniref:2-oxoacid ferredoxin oxidoreductase, gamma subunit n=1 Tax=Desulfatibacillum aliphaticivorans TaxID=218208 RepID=B8FID6_DESAL|nr:2-oxoacid:acceptor oxidoreductase family protein [Desulfatibacillum aliphaticivorans]ACL03926.1 2-oxoacid ferredoxin oxidoreductase, gamma subunit [Desulfatibacillum aliphaticivorans]
MATTRILCAGFGGQGALLIGKLVAEAGMAEGKFVTWLPSYGPEMRGGTANVMVVVSDKPVGSPIFTKMDVLVALNQPSLDKFAKDTKDGGLIITNSDLCGDPENKDKIKLAPVPLTKIAEEIGNVKAANMVGVGALLQLTGCVDRKSVEDYLSHMMKEKNPALLETNMAAIDKGASYVS